MEDSLMPPTKLNHDTRNLKRAKSGVISYRRPLKQKLNIKLESYRTPKYGLETNAQKFSFLKAKRKTFLDQSASTSKQFPGPSSYKLFCVKSAKSCSFPKTKRASFAEIEAKSKKYIPGPNQYKVSNKINKSMNPGYYAPFKYYNVVKLRNYHILLIANIQVNLSLLHKIIVLRFFYQPLFFKNLGCLCLYKSGKSTRLKLKKSSNPGPASYEVIKSKLYISKKAKYFLWPKVSFSRKKN